MTYVLDAVNVFVDGYDLTADNFSVALPWAEDDVENTTMSTAGTTSRTYRSGLESWSLRHGFYLDPDGTTGPSDVPWNGKGSAQVITVAPIGSAENDPAWTGQRLVGTLDLLDGSVGDMASGELNGTGTGELVRGFLLASPAAAVSSSGNTTGLQYAGGVASGEYLYASLHVLAVTSSPTLDVIVQSDTAGFGSPTSQITFTQATAVGSQWGTRVAGTIADDWYRVNYTFGGTGSITFAVTVGIK